MAKHKLKENEAGTEISLKEFIDFYFHLITGIKIYHSTIDSFRVDLNSFVRAKKVGMLLSFIYRDGNIQIDRRKVQPFGLFTETNSIIFISKDNKITFEILFTPEA